jgi:hypothetical protein
MKSNLTLSNNQSIKPSNADIFFPLFGKGNRLYIQKAFASTRQHFGFIYFGAFVHVPSPFPSFKIINIKDMSKQKIRMKIYQA